MPDSILADYLSAEQTAAELRVSPRTLARWGNQPEAPPSVRLGGRRYYHRARLREWIARREGATNPRRRWA